MGERAETYTHGHAESVLRSHRWRTVENSAAYLLPHLRPGIDLLDVGCGPGTITIDLAQRVAPGRVVGHRRRRRRHRRGRARRPTTPASTTSSWPSATCTPSTTPTTRSTSCTPTRCSSTSRDPVAALREMRRVCRPDGVVAARDSVYRAMSWYPGVAGARPVARAVLRGGRGQRRRARRRQPPPRTGASRPASPSVEASATAWCFATDEDRAWWGGLWADRVTQHRAGRPGRGARARHPRRPRRAWRRRGARGPPRPTAGSPCSTARCWPRP